MKVYRHESDGVNAAEDRHTISGSVDRPLLDGYSARECLEIEDNGITTGEDGRLYYKDFEVRVVDTGKSVIAYDGMNKSQVLACKILSRSAV